MKFKFEYTIILIYLAIGSLWIMFSDNFLNSIITDKNILTQLQTYKGWFYVFVTGILLFFLLKKHLNKLRTIESELEDHKNNLEVLIEKKTKDLDLAIKELHKINEKLSTKNDIINSQNSELTLALKNLKETKMQLFQSEKMASIGVMTAGVAHEINNPLNFIKGSSVGLKNYFREYGSQNEKLISVLLNSLDMGINRANDIVKGLNQLSWNSKTNNESCDIHAIIENCLVMLQTQTTNNIVIEKKFLDKSPIITANVGDLHQAIINLLTNAYQAIEEKGKILIITSLDKNQIIIEIIDNGHGISEENLLKITDPFFTTKPPGEGTGLGLSITYNIIKKLNGKLLFESEYGKHTKAIIKLPLN